MRTIACQGAGCGAIVGVLGPRQKYCKPCAKEAHKETEARWRARNPQARREILARSREKNLNRSRNSHLEKNYGITLLERQKMLAQQAGLCAICGVFMKPPCVDHCHATEKIRGLLCVKCNFGIGYLQDNPTICSAAAAYLKGAEVYH